MTETTETKAKAPAKPKRVYVIQNEEGRVLNILSEVAGLEFALITTGGVTPEGMNASLVRATVEKKTPKKELDEVSAMIND